MPRESKKKTPKKKTKEKSTKESETPKMDEDEINRLMQNAFDQANAKFEERLTALREEFNQKHQEEMNELQEQLAQSRGGFTTQEKHTVKELMVDAVTAAHHSKFFEKTPHVPKKFTEALDEYEYNPSVRGDAQLNLLFSYITEMQIGPYLKIRHWLAVLSFFFYVEADQAR